MKILIDTQQLLETYDSRGNGLSNLVKMDIYDSVIIIVNSFHVINMKCLWQGELFEF